MHAKDVMTGSVVCINVRDSIFDAAELLLGARVSAGPVVDDKNAVVGIVSEADLYPARRDRNHGARKGWLARLLDSDVSAANDFAARPYAAGSRRHDQGGGDGSPGRHASRAGRTDGTARRQAHPIVRDGALVGGRGAAPTVCALLSREPERPSAAAERAQALRQAVSEAVEKRAWSSRWPTHVFVSGGVVDLWGFVDDEPTRKAYGVAAENVPGVRSVNNHLRVMPASTGVWGSDPASYRAGVTDSVTLLKRNGKSCAMGER